jgi:hypothetical protein
MPFFNAKPGSGGAKGSIAVLHAIAGTAQGCMRCQPHLVRRATLHHWFWCGVSAGVPGSWQPVLLLVAVCSCSCLLVCKRWPDAAMWGSVFAGAVHACC